MSYRLLRPERQIADMSKPADDTHVDSPRARFYFVIGMAMLTVLAISYVLLFRPNSAVAFLQSHVLPILALATLGAILSGWVQARDQRFRAGLFARSLGRGLIILGAGAAFLPSRPPVLVLSFFVVGFISSVTGAMQLRTARRLKN